MNNHSTPAAPAALSAASEGIPTPGDALGEELLLNNRDLAITCTIAGFVLAVISVLFVHFQPQAMASQVQQWYLYLLYALLLLFTTGWLLLKFLLGSDDTPEQKNKRTRRFFIYGYVAVLLAADLLIATLATDITGMWLFACWYIFTLITLPFFQVVKPLVHLLLALLLQALSVLVLRQAGMQSWLVPWLAGSSVLMGAAYLLGSRVHLAITRQVIAARLMREEYVDIQFKLLQNNQLIRKTVHDLRNPVASIQLLTEYMLKYSATGDDELSGNLQSILECCQQMNGALTDTIKQRHEAGTP
ncbi:histidine kinase dimerization/phospho-acceptor domain-containing protein [Deminuibacter soli]|uniref:histidine kinase n=1 Tax=Deminuibacter soli TaxID=2291815 RepID=A0A3E1NF19_9BACT|nr:histidine kinase dimerization/phospho-acceptor domain-containing protein [Deminuibacter soli]RFM26378.1 hypothetical protein DXN05_20950 [Deminuibacter soli]